MSFIILEHRFREQENLLEILGLYTNIETRKHLQGALEGDCNEAHNVGTRVVLRDRAAVYVDAAEMPLPMQFGDPIGAHDGCQGIVGIEILPDSNTLRCRKCGQEIRIPKQVTTYKELQMWAENVACVT